MELTNATHSLPVFNHSHYSPVFVGTNLAAPCPTCSLHTIIWSNQPLLVEEEEGAFPDASSLATEMWLALGWRRLKEHFAKACV